MVTTAAILQRALPDNTLTNWQLRSDGSEATYDSTVHATISLFVDTAGQYARTLAAQGTAAPYANAWPVKLSDGTLLLGTNASPLVVSVSTLPAISVAGTVEIRNSSGAPIPMNLEALAMFQTAQFTVGTSAAQIALPALTHRRSLSIKALSTNLGIVYIGHTSTVVATTGYPLSAGEPIDIEIDETVNLWAIADTAAQRIAVAEVGET